VLIQEEVLLEDVRLVDTFLEELVLKEQFADHLVAEAELVHTVLKVVACHLVAHACR